jgi:hypothetical protein
MYLTVGEVLTYKQYYKPYELSSEEETRIQDQVADVEELIERELSDFERRKLEHEEAIAREDEVLAATAAAKEGPEGQQQPKGDETGMPVKDARPGADDMDEDPAPGADVTASHLRSRPKSGSPPRGDRSPRPAAPGASGPTDVDPMPMETETTTDAKPQPVPETHPEPQQLKDPANEHENEAENGDGEVMLEGEEDTVIY